jgi:hypothetical protein
MSTHQHADKETYVYRLFNADRELIYIGCTHDVEARINAHRVSAWWYPQVHFSSVEDFSDRTTAHAAEMKAIFTENPKWNIRHRSLGTTGWTAQMYLDYIKAVQMTGPQYAFHRNCVKRAQRFLSALETQAA